MLDSVFRGLVIIRHRCGPFLPATEGLRGRSGPACLGALGGYGDGVRHGNEEVKVRWDNTQKYSAGFRVKDRSDAVTGISQRDPSVSAPRIAVPITTPARFGDPLVSSRELAFSVRVGASR